jgi:GxxExxY protein
MSDQIIHKELSYEVVGCVFDVHNDVGPVLREECYQKAMEIRLTEKNISFRAKPRTRSEFVYRGEIADVFEPDLVIADRIILEFKHQTDGFAPENLSQLISYLKFWNLNLGMLVNFALNSATIERIAYQPETCTCVEDYENILEMITPTQKPILRVVREGLMSIFRKVGLGYRASTYRSLALIEWHAAGLDCVSDVVVEPVFRDVRLPTSPITAVMINETICVQIDALQDSISARAVRTMQSHLRFTRCELGLIACFGKTSLTICGVRP